MIFIQWSNVSCLIGLIADGGDRVAGHAATAGGDAEDGGHEQGRNWKCSSSLQGHHFEVGDTEERVMVATICQAAVRSPTGAVTASSASAARDHEAKARLGLARDAEADLAAAGLVARLGYTFA